VSAAEEKGYLCATSCPVHVLCTELIKMAQVGVLVLKQLFTACSLGMQ
jgi:hypothetical protein